MLKPLVFALLLTAPAAAAEPTVHLAQAAPTAPPAAAPNPAPAQTPAPAPETAQTDPAPAVPKSAQPNPSAQADAGLPEILYGDDGLPEPVKKMRQRLLEAARTGDIDKLRPVLESNETPPIVSLGEEQTDAIEFWKTQSGDGEGREILAILMEVLEAGHLHLDKGTPQEMYVWPYFAQYPLERLTPEQIVELFRLVTAQDYTDMKEYGAYIFFRVGIGPDGTWHFFVAGD